MKRQGKKNTRRKPEPIKPLQKAYVKPIQFNWRRHWSKKVAPYLDEGLVKVCLEIGMRTLDPDWRTGDAPCSLGAIGCKRVVPGKLSWYQPLNRCHHIAFFAFAIGVLNYPELDWKFVSGDRHTVVVGYGAAGEPRIVMDILLFEHYSAEASMVLATQDFLPLKPKAKTKNWDRGCRWIETHIGPALRARAQEVRQRLSNIDLSYVDSVFAAIILVRIEPWSCSLYAFRYEPLCLFAFYHELSVQPVLAAPVKRRRADGLHLIEGDDYHDY